MRAFQVSEPLGPGSMVLYLKNLGCRFGGVADGVSDGEGVNTKFLISSKLDQAGRTAGKRLLPERWVGS